MQGLGERILRIALCDAERLRATCGFRGRVAVNVSAHQVMHSGFPTLVESLLRERKTPPDALELELTETVALHPSDDSVKNVKRLRDLGVGVSMDDFGTGFATIQNIRLMPFSAMKIDRSFVAGIPDKSEDVAVTRAILAMGDALGISVTAEGVETEVQLRGLVELGCRRFQGFLLCHPLDLEKLEARMQLDDFPSFEISEKLSI